MSANENGAPHLQTEIFDWNIPILGICYGLQLLAHTEIPGSVEKADKREYGRAHLLIDNSIDLLKGIKTICSLDESWRSYSSSTSFL